MPATCNFTKKTKFPLFPPNSMLERLSPSFPTSQMPVKCHFYNNAETCFFWCVRVCVCVCVCVCVWGGGGGGGLINKKTIKLSKFDKVPDIISKVAGGCFLSLIKIADNMNKKTACMWIKIPPRLFLILISDLAETLQRTVLTE